MFEVIERAKKRLESADQDVIKARKPELLEKLSCPRGWQIATIAFRSHCCDATDEIQRSRAHIALLESGSTDTSEVMRQKKAKTLNAPSLDLVNMECTWSATEVPVPRNPSTLMSTLINEADSVLKSAPPFV